MKRFLTTLVILLVVIVVGLTALVMLVNPNDFRQYLVEKVEKKSGYQIDFKGDMRWHVWPTLSIITGPVSITAPNASQPVLSAENMRLDVELWPLLSHHLSVEQIVVDGAVIRHTPESEPQMNANSPIAPAGNQRTPNSPEKNQWLLDIEKVEISNSLVIWKTQNDEYNLRNIDLSLNKSDKRKISAKFSGNLNKNQQELRFDARAELDLSQLSHQINGQLTQFDYTFTGVDLPEGGITGQLTSDFAYIKDNIATASLHNIAIKANDSDLTGHVEAKLGAIPDINVQLSSQTLNLDKLIGAPNSSTAANSSNETNLSTRVGVKPVISGKETQKYDLSNLKSFTGNINLNIENLVYRGMAVNAVKFAAQNQAPQLTISQLEGQAFNGQFSLPVSINYSNIPAQVTAKPNIQNINLTPLLKAFNMPEKLSGIVTINADLSGPGYDDYAVKNLWQGPVNFSLQNARLAGLNIPLLIQQSISRVTNKINAPVNTGNYTEVEQFTVNGRLNKGTINIASMNATSPLISITGQGWANVPAETLDVNLGVQITQGWGGDSRFIQQLQSMTIPLRIYGGWSNLQYQLNVERLLRNELKTQAKEALGNFLKKEEQKGLSDLLNAL
ncbi:outer membrane assembly protein AsmA [Providencia vermicola]|uniref:Outer membrane assembly protein AsmA n=3 Tax=Providencia TaxID=586 RepID=A0AAI9MYG4_PROST|nr:MULTISPECIES: outer membrane assembly protein AsmA [Providencia]ELR5037420.1 outer membrane assembly protein AsmA [Providencia stuartii]ELR5143221.1 outer membrane assembly protein AsmA [Providencia stuartii]ELZ5941125.1 outer membrane assembly protein AsmA [Providencia stuartii]WER21271.1 outer membrane assembly protein AsmA [Providencia stuartii]WER25391.1 outer membrane assembly protein AsmA [Providencia stuartii]